MPSRWADEAEFVALSEVLRDHPGTQLENAPEVGRFDEETVERMTLMSLAAGRPINWNLLTVGNYDPDLYANQLAASDYAAERGACIKGLVKPYPSEMYLSFKTGAIIEIISDDWHQLFKLPIPERIAALRDPEWRRRLDVSGGRFEKFSRWADYTVRDVFSEQNEPLRNRKIGEIAAATGRTPFETILDVVLADDLETDLQGPTDDGGQQSWQARLDLCRDPRLIVGGSDAGGHLDIICGAVLTTRTLREYIDRELMPLPELIHQMTDIPARYLGLRERGRLAPGYAADVVIFDPTTVDARSLTRVADLPGGAERLMGDSVGVEHVLVNGVPVVAGGQLVEANNSGGRVLRSGRDTTTVDNAMARRIGSPDDN